MVPLGYFVIAPAIAQKIMYATTIALPNSTMIPCDGHPHAMLMNTVKVYVPGPFSATLQPYKTVLSTTTCGAGVDIKGGWNCEKPQKTVLGSYMAPKQVLKPGHNELQFVAGMDIADASGSSLMQGFIEPMFFYSHSAELTIASEDVDVVAGLTILGITINIKTSSLKLHNELTCSQVTYRDFHDIGGYPIPNSICFPGGVPKAEPGSGGITGRRLQHDKVPNSFEMQCKAGLIKETATTTSQPGTTEETTTPQQGTTQESTTPQPGTTEETTTPQAGTTANSTVGDFTMV